jgi:hypothetical protein
MAESVEPPGGGGGGGEPLTIRLTCPTIGQAEVDEQLTVTEPEYVPFGKPFALTDIESMTELGETGIVPFVGLTDSQFPLDAAEALKLMGLPPTSETLQPEAEQPELLVAELYVQFMVGRLPAAFGPISTRRVCCNSTSCADKDIDPKSIAAKSFQ